MVRASFWLAAASVFRAVAGEVAAVESPSVISAPEPESVTLPQLALVFMTKDGTGLRNVWQNWIDQGGKDLAEFSYKVRAVMFHSDVLQPSEHRDRFLGGSVLREQGPAAQRFLLLEPERALFKRALELFPRASHFAFISATTIPVKPLREIVRDLMLDPRSRLDVFCRRYRDASPKHSQWVVLRRKHAEAFAKAPEVDARNQLIIPGVCDTGGCATDEYWPVTQIMSALGITKDEELDREFKIKDVSGPLASLEWSTAVDWFQASPDGSALFGRLDEDSGENGHPARYVEISARLLRTLRLLPDVWFFRTVFSDDTTVQYCDERPEGILARLLQADIRNSGSARSWRTLYLIDEKDYGFCRLDYFLKRLFDEGAFAAVAST